MSNATQSISLLFQRAALSVGLYALMVCQGCMTSGAMLAKDLPREWYAVSASNAQTVDLTKLASATIPQDIISVGDVITVDISVGSKKDEDRSALVRVRDNGEIDLAHVGNVPVLGLSMQEAEQSIRTVAMARDVYVNPKVVVVMTRPKVNRITVMGAVNKPGSIELRPGNSDLLQAITLAGGLAKEAGTVVEVRHPGFIPGSNPKDRMPAIANGTSDGVISAGAQSLAVTPVGARTLKVDLVAIGSEGVGIPTLSDGTVIWVDKRDPLPLTVDGLVRSPGQFEFPVGKNLTVLDAIALAHGINSPVADKIYVIRKRPGIEQPALIQVSYSKTKRDGKENILLQPGDVVSVEQTPSTIIISVLQTATFGLSGRVF